MIKPEIIKGKKVKWTIIKCLYSLGIAPGPRLAKSFCTGPYSTSARWAGRSLTLQLLDPATAAQAATDHS